MEIIRLTQRQITIVNDIDFKWLNQWKWCAQYNQLSKKYYAVRTVNLGKDKSGRIKTKMYYMHREIIKKQLIEERKFDLFVDFVDNPSKYPVDHINHDSLFNMRKNLRIVTSRQNNQNRERKVSSIFPGVTWDKENNKWKAQIWVGNKLKFLGRFEPSTLGERKAAQAYEKACRELGQELVCKTKS